MFSHSYCEGVINDLWLLLRWFCNISTWFIENTSHFMRQNERLVLIMTGELKTERTLIVHLLICHVLIIQNNLGKTDPSEIERTYNIWKQQTRFYWVCSWELMESATILTPPSNGLSGILLSERIHYSRRTRIWKNINTKSMYGDKFLPIS